MVARRTVEKALGTRLKQRAKANKWQGQWQDYHTASNALPPSAPPGGAAASLQNLHSAFGEVASLGQLVQLGSQMATLPAFQRLADSSLAGSSFEDLLAYVVQTPAETASTDQVKHEQARLPFSASPL